MNNTNGKKLSNLSLCWWIPLTFIPGLTFIPFIYAGISSKDRKLIYYGYLYSTPLVLELWGFSYLPIELTIAIWVAGIVHAFIIRDSYIKKRLEVKHGINKNSNSDLSVKNKLRKEKPIKVNMNKKRATVDLQEVEEKLDAIVKDTDKLDLGKGKEIETTSKIKEEIETLVDINSCDEKELEKLPFVTVILAKKAIAVREQKGGFNSIEEFGISIGLKPHMIEKIRPLVKIEEVKKAKVVSEKRRIIDL